MLTRSGEFVHIDFGHILGHFKTKAGIGLDGNGVVLTPAMMYAITRGSATAHSNFVQLSCDLYKIIRRHANRLIGQFSMMLDAGLPELKRPELQQLRQRLNLEVDETEALSAFASIVVPSSTMLLAKHAAHQHKHHQLPAMAALKSMKSQRKEHSRSVRRLMTGRALPS